jgi:YVTN family beta-propeller protein
VLYATSVARSAADPRVGTELGGYYVEALVGRGGMGVVYRAEDRRLGRKVALKLLPPELADDEGFRDRFLRESRLAASLDHQSVIPIYDAGEADGLLFIAMRYVDGTDLRTLLKQEGALEPARTLAILAQVASALDAAHARGLVHRDVKPANILIAGDTGPEREDHVYLTDFGLTKATGSGTRLTATGQFVGTIDYVPPEQIRGTELGGRGDQYALGCVLYECLTGEPPYQRDSEVAVLWAHVQDEPPRATDRRAELPTGIDSVIAKALAKDPDDRYGTCRELVAAARAELGISSGTRPAPSAHAPAVLRPPRWRNRAYLLAGTGALAVAAAVVAVVLIVAGGNGGGAAAPPAQIEIDSVSAVDPATNRFSATVNVGARPEALAIGAGGIWVVNFDDRTVSKIDPETRAVLKTIASGGTPTGIALGEDAVWVTNGFEGRVTRIDSERVAIDDSIEVGSGAQAIAAGEGAVWVGGNLAGTLLRIDPATNEVVATIDVGESPTGVAVGDGSVWVANAGDSSVSRVDPATNEVSATIPLRFAPRAIGIGPSGVWVTNDRDDSVSTIDPASNRVTGTIAVGDGPQGIAVTEGAVWVTNGVGGTISRIDPAAGEVVATLEVGNSPDGIAVAEDGTVWFTTHAL